MDSAKNDLCTTAPFAQKVLRINTQWTFIIGHTQVRYSFLFFLIPNLLHPRFLLMFKTIFSHWKCNFFSKFSFPIKNSITNFYPNNWSISIRFHLQERNHSHVRFVVRVFGRRLIWPSTTKRIWPKRVQSPQKDQKLSSNNNTNRLNSRIPVKQLYRMPFSPMAPALSDK